VEKYGTARQVTDDNVIRRMHFACYITKATNAHSEYIILVRSKDSQVKTQLVLWIFILFKVTRGQHVSASITRPSSGHK